jgi:Bacterial alpha-L-rhamnosidase concanavalin-like domain
MLLLRLNPDGMIYMTNLREARVTDTYICGGEGQETWSPRFTFHGFQYVEVTGLKSPPTQETITGIALSSDTPIAGQFACSDTSTSRYRRIRPPEFIYRRPPGGKSLRAAGRWPMPRAQDSFAPQSAERGSKSIRVTIPSASRSNHARSRNLGRESR